MLSVWPLIIEAGSPLAPRVRAVVVSEEKPIRKSRLACRTSSIVVVVVVVVAVVVVEAVVVVVVAVVVCGSSVYVDSAGTSCSYSCGKRYREVSFIAPPV